VDETFEIDEFSCWIDSDSIQIKAVTKFGDPVDLGTEEVRQIIAALTRMVKAVDGE
jgi:hypothetical protein